MYRRPRLTFLEAWHFVHRVFTRFIRLSEQMCVFLNPINRIIFSKGISCVFLEFGRKFSYIIQTIIPPTLKYLIDHFLAKPHFSASLMDNGWRIRQSTGYGLRRWFVVLIPGRGQEISFPILKVQAGFGTHHVPGVKEPGREGHHSPSHSRG